MADYREISQQYAQGAVKTCILVNGGAAVALLSQAAELIRSDFKCAVMGAMLIWALGVVSGAATWIVAFLSTRYVDKSERESGLEQVHLARSNSYMHTGIGFVVFSLTMFLGGAIFLAVGLSA